MAREGMGYGMLLVIGLLTSVHCVSMCGGISLSQCLSSGIRSSLLYNLGRVVSYTLIGGIVGAVGSVVSFSGAMKGAVQLAAGLFMVAMGLNMLDIFPWLRRLSPRGYEPIAVKAGVPVRWTIRAESGTVNGCNSAIYIPEYEIAKQLVVGDNIIEFTPENSGTFPYSCWMGMIWSSITVE